MHVCVSFFKIKDQNLKEKKKGRERPCLGEGAGFPLPNGVGQHSYKSYNLCFEENRLSRVLCRRQKEVEDSVGHGLFSHYGI